jgi:hypothetical protein
MYVSAQSNAPDQKELMTAYNAAIQDSSVYKFSNLRPLLPLKFDPITRTVTVVTLTTYPYKQGEMKLQRDVWVTAVPEVRTACRRFDGDVALRLTQLLGLRPGTQIGNFVTLTVKEGDIFRPALYTDPTTTLPCGIPVTPTCGGALPPGTSDCYISWLGNQMLSSYVISESPYIPLGYPWTRLGYTYDWHPGSNKYGASEYVIHKDKTVEVMEITPYQSYCIPEK